VILNCKKKKKKNSCRGTFRSRGDLYAVPHPVKARGSNSGPRFDGTTTYQSGFGSTATATATATSGGARGGGRLATTAPSAATRPWTSSRAQGHTALGCSGDIAKSPFVTTNKRHYSANLNMPVGSANQGIMSEYAKWVHKRQAD